jgi:snRNA-activating protein complex subunit 3
LLNVLNNPRLTAYVLKTHEYSVNSINESADASNKRKRKRYKLPEPSQEHPEVIALRARMDNIKLKCWPLALDAALFVRGPKFTDQNPFTRPVC